MENEDYDRLLHIHTTEELMGLHRSMMYHRYEPTPYRDLLELFGQYELKPGDRVVDYGCGKGRLNFFLHDRFGVDVVGVEMNEGFYQKALENRESYLKNRKQANSSVIEFQNCLAEEYKVRQSDNRFYFFNPFTVEIFRRVVDNILESVEQHYRNIELILYYPSEDYVYYLENHSLFEWKQEVRLRGYEGNVNERFLVYGMVY
ncbi:SAM-dependent methyltransferase [Bacillus tianshenii]|uniref:SAM-dependent methyltransferase n=1 Tax=Sutcliffiella tianshenii TaxID=1463404 RepID=A0ABS2NZS5_9BACI|nr:methyltransferase domain-containing protein [Bacillus tianshenii]MBM7619907.1 SAM-dependent methyltransferase [Bacillus tianshenii]